MTITLCNVAVYTETTFGIMRIDCAQFERQSDGCRYRAPRARTWKTLPPAPWLVVLPLAKALPVDSGLVQHDSGLPVARYPARDPQYRLDFEEQVKAAGVTPVLMVAAGGG